MENTTRRVAPPGLDFKRQITDDYQQPSNCTFPARRARPSNVDVRLSFLHRAHARLLLFEAGEMTLGQAIDGLVDSLQCPCEREPSNVGNGSTVFVRGGGGNEP